MMSTLAHLISLVAGLLCTSSATAVTIVPPPSHDGFDYQIGGAYPPPAGVRVVGRDHSDRPAAGLYNICYINAFQAQPDTESEWGDLLLRDGNGEIVYDDQWGEAMLDIRSAGKRQRIAATVNGWIDQCASKGFEAVEPDNYDTYTRAPDGLLTASQAQSLIRLLSAHAHDVGLAIAQKNTVELAGNRVANGLDFAVAEECGQWDECGDYVNAFGNNVIVIEYSGQGLRAACADWGARLSIVRRDVQVSTPRRADYEYETC